MFYYLMVLINIFDPLYAHVQQQSFHANFLESLKKNKQTKQNKTPQNKLNTDFFLFSSAAKP